MKKIIFIIILLMFIFNPFQVVASSTDPSVPYDTYTIGPEGRRIKTQTAYDPAGFINTNIDLLQPEDMVIKDGYIYVADTGNRRVLKLNMNGDLILEINNANLVKPTGVFVSDEEIIYVADQEARVVMTFNQEGQLLSTFERPVEPIFGRNSPYVPTKIVVGKRGNMYIIGQGSTSGVIQLNHTGEFIGFFGTNFTGISFLQRLANLLNVEFAPNTPTSAMNIAIDDQGAIYTVSPTDSKPLKRFNIASIDTLENEYSAPGLVAVTTNQIGNIVTLSNQGILTEYDSFGHMIFEFGGLDNGDNQRLGLNVNPVALAIDNNNNIYVLDRTMGKIQAFHTSQFTKTVHQGLMSFKDGIYDISEWNEVLSLNEMFALANSAIGQANFRLGHYDEAMHYYLLAYDKEGYSNAFWQVRYSFLQNQLGLVFMGLILFLTAKKSLSFADRKYQIYEPVRKFKKKVYQIRLFKELSLLHLMLFHPLDTLYDLKFRKRSSYLTATLIYLLVTILSIITVIGPAFIFRNMNIESFFVIRHVGIVLGLMYLFVFANYLVSTINEGEGWFKDVYIGFAYALAPYIFLSLPVVLLSYGLTLYEVFIFDFINLIMYSWTVLYLVIMIKEIHGYSIRALVKNIILTIFSVLLMILILVIVYLLLYQVYDYVFGFIREVIQRVGR
jgi:tetratricopeptide (TPR) repeat protein